MPAPSVTERGSCRKGGCRPPRSAPSVETNAAPNRSPNNGHHKCRCTMMYQIKGKTKGKWYTGVAYPPGRFNRKCQTYNTFKYRTGGAEVDGAVQIRARPHAATDRRPQIPTFWPASALSARSSATSRCRPTAATTTAGHTMAATGSLWRASPARTRISPRTARAAIAAAAQGARNALTTVPKTWAACDNRLDTESAMTWASAPLLHKVCGSINTGGGVGVGYKIDGNADTLLCGLRV